MKKLIAFVMALCLLSVPSGIQSVQEIPVVSHAEEITSENLTFIEYDDHVIVSKCEFRAEGEIVIPSEVNGKPVTSIEGFGSCYWITSVIIPDTVTSINYGAFRKCTSLENISIPESVTSIGEKAFEESLWLELQQQENPLVIVNDIVVDGTACEGEVIIPEGMRIINNYAFYKNEAVTSVIIPDSVTDIKTRAFQGCINLKNISVPESVTSFQAQAFWETPWLEHKKSENPLVIINDILIDGTACEGEVTIPDNVHTIGEFAFYMCETISSVVIPDTVTSIGKTTFYHCVNLESIILPENIDCIPPSMFVFCKNLKSVHIPESVTSIGSNAFSSCLSLTEIIIPEQVTEIGDSAFNGCTGLTEITVPDSVTEIGSFAFQQCVNMTSVHLGTGLTAIESDVFVTTGLTEITIPENVQSIGQEAFRGCRKLTSVVIPANVNKISGWAFFDCADLQSVTIENPDCKIANDAYTFFNGDNPESSDGLFSGTVYGYSDSTAQTYAENCGYNFEPIAETTELKGDVNADGVFNVPDVVLLQKWLLSVPDTHLTDWKTADFTNDDKLDVFDLVLMKKALLEENK
ncbi:MAG: leucine-rich repeat protein [Ruminococcus sp.]|nr:leucine-rich repeat protein [Ruminococcus sp.]